MGDSTLIDHVTDRSLSWRLKLHSQHCTLAYSKKVNKMQLDHVSSPLNLPSLVYKIKYARRYYSHLSNKCGGWNEIAGGAKNRKSKKLELEILQEESSPFVFK